MIKKTNHFLAAILTFFLLVFGLIVFFGYTNDLKVRFIDVDLNKNGSVKTLDTQLKIHFSSSENKEQIESLIEFSPNIEWSSAWLGRTMIINFEQPLEYAMQYKLKIQKIDFEYTFHTDSKKLFYIDSSVPNQRPLIEHDLTNNVSRVVSPIELAIVDYEFNKPKNQIVALATPIKQLELQGEMNIVPNLYTIDLSSGKTKMIEDANGKILFNFAVSEDGETIIVDRLNLNQDMSPADRSLYIKTNLFWRKFWKPDAIGDVLFFVPNSDYLLMLEMNRFVIASLFDPKESPQLIGEYFNSYGFSKDGKMAFFTRWKNGAPYAETNELIVLHSDGKKQTLFQDLGEIQSVTFSPQLKKYFLIIIPKGSFDTQFYSYDVLSSNLLPILSENNFLEENISISFDEKNIVMQQDSYDNQGDGTIMIYDINNNTWQDMNVKARLPKWFP